MEFFRKIICGGDFPSPREFSKEPEEFRKSKEWQQCQTGGGLTSRCYEELESDDWEQCENTRQAVKEAFSELRTSTSSTLDHPIVTKQVNVKNPKSMCFRKLVSDLRAQRWNVKVYPVDSIQQVSVTTLLDRVSFNSESPNDDHLRQAQIDVYTNSLIYS